MPLQNFNEGCTSWAQGHSRSEERKQCTGRANRTITSSAGPEEACPPKSTLVTMAAVYPWPSCSPRATTRRCLCTFLARMHPRFPHRPETTRCGPDHVIADKAYSSRRYPRADVMRLPRSWVGSGARPGGCRGEAAGLFGGKVRVITQCLARSETRLSIVSQWPTGSRLLCMRVWSAVITLPADRARAPRGAPSGRGTTHRCSLSLNRVL